MSLRSGAWLAALLGALLLAYFWGRQDGRQLEAAAFAQALHEKQAALNAIRTRFDGVQAQLLKVQHLSQQQLEALDDAARQDPHANNRCLSADSVLRLDRIR